MGKVGTEITGVDNTKLLKMLNSALADEWLAYYQYWVGANVAVGMMRGVVAAELLEHAAEELAHADLLVARIAQLGGTPVLEPKEWYRVSGCGYHVPKNPDTKVLLKQNIDGERCAIKAYKKIMEYVRGKDEVTFKLALEIMQDEIEHEEDLEAIVEDMKKARK